jgi:asparagine synthase (glutamine-hydrolysing)
MCGISAIIGNVDDKEDKLKLSLSKIAHRGEPEHQFEHRVFDNAALGANRLAIVDEELGGQPQANENETIFAILNGEIFNFEKLAEELKQKGHIFRTQSDTEVLAHLWEDRKEEFVVDLDSEMFALVIFDKATNEVFAARDRLGVKPLYYAHDMSGALYFASEIKALVCLDGVTEVHEFPPGHYFYKDQFVKYWSVAAGKDKNPNLNNLKTIIEEAVRKRVRTEMPIAVFLSGGVDSSMVMELATRFHRDVTALILGEKDSLDRVSAVEICEKKGWKYKITEPRIDYENELPDTVYYVESYDPNIVRHSYANDVISKLAHVLGFKVVLTGEGIDEIFAGYNEFLEMNGAKINDGCSALLASMSRGNLMRIDKMAMRHTVEVRCPFFDQALVGAAMAIDGSLKVGEYNGKKFTKLIFRKIAAEYLPESTAFREKAPFANGAGMNVGVNYKKSDGVLSEIAQRLVPDAEFEKIKNEFPDRGFETKEEILIFEKYRDFGYDRFAEGKERLITKDVLKNHF